MVTDAFQQMGGTGIMLTETLEKTKENHLLYQTTEQLKNGDLLSSRNCNPIHLKNIYVDNPPHPNTRYSGVSAEYVDLFLCVQLFLLSFALLSCFHGICKASRADCTIHAVQK